MASLCTSASECFQLVLKFSLSFHFPQPVKLVSGRRNNLFAAVSFSSPELRRRVARPTRRSELKTNPHSEAERADLLSPWSQLFSPFSPVSLNILFHSFHAHVMLLPFKGNSMKLHFCIQEASGYPASAAEKRSRFSSCSLWTLQ